MFKGRPLSSKPPKDSSYGFVYLLTLNDGRVYYGKKSFWSITKKPPLKNSNSRAKRIITKESDWRSYTGSSKVFGSKDIASKTILHIAKSKRNLTYLETKLLFEKNVLEDENCLNISILGKFFKNNLI